MSGKSQGIDSDGAHRGHDALTVVQLQRLGRSTRNVLNLVHELEQKGAHLRGA